MISFYTERYVLTLRPLELEFDCEENNEHKNLLSEYDVSVVVSYHIEENSARRHWRLNCAEAAGPCWWLAITRVWVREFSYVYGNTNDQEGETDVMHVRYALSACTQTHTHRIHVEINAFVCIRLREWLSSTVSVHSAMCFFSIYSVEHVKLNIVSEVNWTMFFFSFMLLLFYSYFISDQMKSVGGAKDEKWEIFNQ